MLEMKNKILETLEKYNQLHLMKFYDELSETEKHDFEKQVEKIDFSMLSLIEEDNKKSSKGVIQPIGAMTVDEIKKRKDEFFNCGIEVIKNGKLGAVLLAGGQGTRLGFDKAKGMFNIGVERTLYIFECLINNLMDTVKKADVWVNLFIMTSEKNNDDIVKFFEEHNYFGYNKEYISFFVQDMAVSVDYNGKIFLEDKGKISLSPNGNGGWFSSLKNSEIYNKIKSSGIEWLNVFAVDNVLQKMADPCFIGAMIATRSKSGSKVVRKANADEKVGVLCLEDGKPSIIEYYEMTEEMRNLKNPDGSLAYNFGVILNYIFSVESLEGTADAVLPIHVVEKKIPYINENGELINPEENNGYKFETLVLDMVHMQENCLAYEVIRENEFAPVKNKEGVDSISTARELLVKNGVEI